MTGAKAVHLHCGFCRDVVDGQTAKLWCGHVGHLDCARKVVVENARCPVCERKPKGKKTDLIQLYNLEPPDGWPTRQLPLAVIRRMERQRDEICAVPSRLRVEVAQQIREREQMDDRVPGMHSALTEVEETHAQLVRDVDEVTRDCEALEDAADAGANGWVRRYLCSVNMVEGRSHAPKEPSAYSLMQLHQASVDARKRRHEELLRQVAAVDRAAAKAARTKEEADATIASLRPVIQELRTGQAPAPPRFPKPTIPPKRRLPDNLRSSTAPRPKAPRVAAAPQEPAAPVARRLSKALGLEEEEEGEIEFDFPKHHGSGLGDFRTPVLGRVEHPLQSLWQA
mmetsp:Transcript_41129/g.89644  ORF Transcript_41129/g.89644 Transcript_41129/m.89644 type:complete len:340 (+) Transcript_41129:77-1096(+)